MIAGWLSVKVRGGICRFAEVVPCQSRGNKPARSATYGPHSGLPGPRIRRNLRPRPALRRHSEQGPTGSVSGPSDLPERSSTDPGKAERSHAARRARHCAVSVANWSFAAPRSRARSFAAPVARAGAEVRMRARTGSPARRTVRDTIASTRPVARSRRAWAILADSTRIGSSPTAARKGIRHSGIAIPCRSREGKKLGRNRRQVGDKVAGSDADGVRDAGHSDPPLTLSAINAESPFQLVSAA